MQTSIITIGNSQGIRIPKLLLEVSGIEKEVELKVRKGEITIVPIRKNLAEITQASEATLEQDWGREEEDEAWADL